MKIAIEGCCHGELDAIYSHIERLETQNKYKVDLLLICGDFQAIRNRRDLQCIAVPDKYRQLGGFYKYYTGEKRAPILTIVIGGNHEASNYFWELYHGGWLAPNIYFLGHAGCVQVNGIRIAGASGIFKSHDFQQGHWERLPYDNGAMRSLYHIREFNIRRLSLLSSPTIFLSHDWPQAIEHHGNLPDLLRRKPYFRDDINKGVLGSPPLMGLLHTLRPKWWFSAHLHCRFEARVTHAPKLQSEENQIVGGANPDEIVIEDEDDTTVDAGPSSQSSPVVNQEISSPSAERNPDEILMDDMEEEVEAPPPPPPPPPPSVETKFLALDKCLPKRQFLEVIDVRTPSDAVDVHSKKGNGSFPVLTFDPEWLAITRAFHPYMSLSRFQQPYPDEAQARELVKQELQWVQEHLMNDDGDRKSVGKRGYVVGGHQKFVITAPAPGTEGAAVKQQPPFYPNPQTAAFCTMLNIENKIDAAYSAPDVRVQSITSS